MSDRGESGWLHPRTLGWALYLGMSWTWCIGMFLPLVLARDFGLWSFVAFAVPNVAGAAAMGVVLSRRGAGGILLEHGQAVRVFTDVTIAFQVFFMGWVAFSSGGWVWSAIVATTTAGALLTTAAMRSGVLGGLAAAALVFALSLGALGTTWGMGGLSWPVSGGMTPLGGARSIELLALAPVCMLGFLLCPYLDATFLRAIRRQRRAARSFILGFGAFFLAMIVATVLYAGRFDLAGGPSRMHEATGIIAILIAAHLGVQLGFTMSAHAAAAPPPMLGTPPHGWRRIGPRMALIVGIGGSLVVQHFAGSSRYAGLAVGEVIYRSFMVFYGLVFPAYVLLCIVPVRGMPNRAITWNLWVCAMAIAAALPAYWMGFIERQTWWLLAGVAVVIAARAFIRVPEPGGGGPRERFGAPVPIPPRPRWLAAAGPAPGDQRGPDR